MISALGAQDRRLVLALRARLERKHDYEKVDHPRYGDRVIVGT